MRRSWLRRVFARTSTRPAPLLGVFQLEDRIVPYQLGSRWSATASTPGPLQQGDPTTVTWGFVRDGVTVPGGSGPNGPSELITRLDAAYGSGPGGNDFTQRPWFPRFQQAFARLSAVSGLTYVYEPNDDGASFPGSGGVLGVRADARISGRPNLGGALAFNYFPNGGEMVIETTDFQAGGFYLNSSNNYRALRNVLMHEQGHGVGLGHQMPNNGTVMMNPTASLSFDGPQFDDILGLQRLYGDAREKGGGNDTVGTATSLGAVAGNGTVRVGIDGNVSSMLIAGTATDFVSIDGSSDRDVFSFTVTGGTTLSLTLAPLGITYLDGAQGGSPPVPFDALRQSDLVVELLDASGAVLQTANANGLGGSETIVGFPVATGGTFHARVRGTQNVIQLYQLAVTSTVVSVTTQITRGPAQPATTNASPVRFAVTFNYPVTGFDPSDIQFTAGSLTTGLTAIVTPNGAGGDRYFVDVFGANGTGTIGIAIPAAAVVAPAFGVPNAASTTPPTELVTFNNVSPVPVFTPAALGLTPATTTPVTLTFPIAVTPFTASALVLANATVANFTQVAADRYTFDLRPTSDGAFSATLPAGTAADAFGNQNVVATLAGTFDGTAPTAIIARQSAAVTTTGPAVFEVRFSESVAAGSFTATDIGFSGSTVGGTLAAAVDPAPGVPNAFLVTVTGMAGTGTVRITLPAGAATDLAGNPNPVTFTPPADVVQFDGDAPTVSFNPGSPLTTNLTTVPVTLTFSEPVTGFTAAGVEATGSVTVSNFQPVGDGMTFTLTLTLTTDGTFTLTVPAGAADDLAGNTTPGATLTGGYDATAPVASISRVSPAQIKAAPAVYEVRFSEPVAAGSFTAADIGFAGSTAGGTLAAAVAPAPGVPNAFLVAVSGMTSSGTVRISLPAGAVTDLAGNPTTSTAVAPADVTFDNVAPSATLTTTLPGETNSPSVPVTLTFSEPVVGFTATGLVVTGPAAVQNFVSVGDGRTFTFSLGRTADGAFGVQVPAAAATDPAGNPNTTATLNGVFDTTPPTLTVTPTAAAFTDTAVTFDVTFSEPTAATTPLTADEVTFGGTARPQGITVSPGVGSQTYVVTVSGMLRNGTVTIGVAAGAVTDPAGNPAGGGSAVADFTTTAPPPVALIGAKEFAAGPGDGETAEVQLYNPDGTLRFRTPAFDAAFAGGVRTTVADFTRDGIADLVIGSGPGGPSLVRLLDGRSGEELLRLQPFESSFTGGVFVAAGDLTGDGIPDLVVTPDEGGGPRVQVFRGVDLKLVANFFGIDDPNFRGGARAGVGDINGDGRADLLVAAGFGGGPRVAGIDGTTFTNQPTNRNPRRLFHDMFVFEPGLRNGVYVTAGDLDDDGLAELVVGGGPGGAPRVLALSGADLMAGRAGQSKMLANFFAGDTENRSGIRVAVKNLDGDRFADLVVGPGAGAGTRVTAYHGKDITAGGTGAAFAFDAYPGVMGGVFVG